MSVSGGCHPTVVVAGIEINRMGAITVTEIDAEQPGYILTDVVVVLHFQLLPIRGRGRGEGDGRPARPRPLAPALAPPLDGGQGRFDTGGLAMAPPEEDDTTSGTNLRRR